MAIRGSTGECFAQLVKNPMFIDYILPAMQTWVRASKTTLSRWIGGVCRPDGLFACKLDVVMSLLGCDVISFASKPSEVQFAVKLLVYEVLSETDILSAIGIKYDIFQFFKQKHVRRQSRSNIAALCSLRERYQSEVDRIEKEFLDKLPTQVIESLGLTERLIPYDTTAVVTSEVLTGVAPPGSESLLGQMTESAPKIKSEMTHNYLQLKPVICQYLERSPALMPVFKKFMGIDDRFFAKLYSAPSRFFFGDNLFKVSTFLELLGYESNFIAGASVAKKKICAIIGFSLESLKSCASRFGYVPDSLSAMLRYRTFLGSPRWDASMEPLLTPYDERVSELRINWTKDIEEVLRSNKKSTHISVVEDHAAALTNCEMINVDDSKGVYSCIEYGKHVVNLTRSLVPLLGVLVKDCSLSERDHVRLELGSELMSEFARLAAALCSEESRNQCFQLKNERSSVDAARLLERFVSKKSAVRS